MARINPQATTKQIAMLLARTGMCHCRYTQPTQHLIVDTHKKHASDTEQNEGRDEDHHSGRIRSIQILIVRSTQICLSSLVSIPSAAYIRKGTTFDNAREKKTLSPIYLPLPLSCYLPHPPPGIKDKPL